MSYVRNDMFDAIAFGMTMFDKSGRAVPIRLGIDWAQLGSDIGRVHRVRSAHAVVRHARAQRRPRLHPTKGYRGAHKLFRGGSR